MKTVKNYFFIALAVTSFAACSKSPDVPDVNHVELRFHNTFKNKNIVLGDSLSTIATVNTSAEGQEHYFSELKYAISNIRLVKVDSTEIPYHINDLDQGAAVINQAKAASLSFLMASIPAGEYVQLKFGLGIKQALNTLDQLRFPKFYAEAGANDTEMMWEWGTGYRFTKIEGFYDTDSKTMSIHTGSTIEGEEGAFTQGVDAYREIVLSLDKFVVVENENQRIDIKADFDKLLSGKINTIKLVSGTGHDANATPNIHTAVQMVKFVDNIGGDGKTDHTGMFSIQD